MLLWLFRWAHCHFQLNYFDPSKSNLWKESINSNIKLHWTTKFSVRIARADVVLPHRNRDPQLPFFHVLPFLLTIWATKWNSEMNVECVVHVLTRYVQIKMISSSVYFGWSWNYPIARTFLCSATKATNNKMRKKRRKLHSKCYKWKKNAVQNHTNVRVRVRATQNVQHRLQHTHTYKISQRRNCALPTTSK